MELFNLKGVNGQMTVYEDKVVIERKGVTSFLTQGIAGAKTIPIQSIQSIQFKPGNHMTNGFIQFGILGGKEGQGGLFNATKDENTVMLSFKYNELAGQIKEYIEKRILENFKSSNQQTIIQPASTADEILKLKSLLDSEIITEEEFNAKKKQLLDL